MILTSPPVGPVQWPEPGPAGPSAELPQAGLLTDEELAPQNARLLA
jgi:hypothetical protein